MIVLPVFGELSDEKHHIQKKAVTYILSRSPFLYYQFAYQSRMKQEQTKEKKHMHTQANNFVHFQSYHKILSFSHSSLETDKKVQNCSRNRLRNTCILQYIFYAVFFKQNMSKSFNIRADHCNPCACLPIFPNSSMINRFSVQTNPYDYVSHLHPEKLK